MFYREKILSPFLFNPLKHHLEVIKEFILTSQGSQYFLTPDNVVKSVKHLGGSVMDIYSGILAVKDIINEITNFLENNNINDPDAFSGWAGKGSDDIRVIELSDKSLWTLKYHTSKTDYIHLFPARYSPHTFRVKANTLKSAILYIICVGKDFVTEEDLNMARAVAGLSPIKDVIDSEAITEMIEILRG